MEVSSVSSSNQLMDIYAEGLRKQAELAETITKINMELQMKADKLEMAQELLGQFYA